MHDSNTVENATNLMLVPPEESGQVEQDPYQRFSPAKKRTITAMLSLCGFLAPMSSTAVLSALPEVAASYNTTRDIISLTNTFFLAAMAVSPLFYGPMSRLYGRRIIMITCAVLFSSFSVLTALAPNLPAFIIGRIVTAFQGTSFLVVGATCISDIYRPTERATALGWFLSGTNIAPAIAPFLGGVFVTYATWREIFWFQTGLSGLAAILLVLFLPETSLKSGRESDLKKTDILGHLRRMGAATNPLPVLLIMYHYPTVLLVALASAAVVWNLYSVLTPIRYVINPRFHLDSALQSGLIFLAPGLGSFVGTFVGGRWADRYMRKYAAKIGKQIPENRLRSCVSSLGIIIPGALLIYGWTITEEVGGLPVPIICMFVMGVFQMVCIPSLNTYCLDVLQPQGKTAEAVACNYLLRYMAAAIGSGVVLPIVNAIGLGWFCLITTIIMVLSTVGVVCCIAFGLGWREKQLVKEESS